MRKTGCLFIRLSILVLLFFSFSKRATAQEGGLKDHYVGLIPSFLAEPYDTIKALEVNLFPFLYELRIGEKNDFSFQFRPILNYRFYKPQSGFSQIGFTGLANKYFTEAFREDHWLIPQVALYFTYTYNRLDKIQTLTVGVEGGLYFVLSERFSLSANLQPGINYYPDDFSRDFVETESGFKSHFGVIIHVGYNF